jgi:hypothetical protein
MFSLNGTNFVRCSKLLSGRLCANNIELVPKCVGSFNLFLLLRVQRANDSSIEVLISG